MIRVVVRDAAGNLVLTARTTRSGAVPDALGFTQPVTGAEVAIDNGGDD